MGGGDQGPA
ncbi:hypothetical protein LINPERPRIM_LOCUS14011 [Linum perenne]